MLAMSTLMMPAPTIAMGAPPPITMGPHKPPETKLLAIHPAAVAANGAGGVGQQSHLQHNGQHPQSHQQQPPPNQQQQQQSQQTQQQISAGNNNSNKPGECSIFVVSPRGGAYCVKWRRQSARQLFRADFHF